MAYRVYGEFHEVVMCRIKVDRSLSPSQMLHATGRMFCTNSSVVDSIPLCQGEDVNVYFFRCLSRRHGEPLCQKQVALEYKRRGLIPDVYAQAAVNKAYPRFADDYPNAVAWSFYWAEFYNSCEGGKSFRQLSFHKGEVARTDRMLFGGVEKK